MICRDPIGLVVATVLSLVYAVDYFWPKPDLCYIQINEEPFVAKWVECPDEYKIVDIESAILLADSKQNEI